MTFAIRRYAETDHATVRDLFIEVNRELAPPAMREAFEGYVAVSLREEVALPAQQSPLSISMP